MEVSYFEIRATKEEKPEDKICDELHLADMEDMAKSVSLKQFLEITKFV
jgi:hypothetical protein